MTKDVEDTSESFLSRWAKRKADVRAEEVKSGELRNTNPSTSALFEAKMPEDEQPERSLPNNENDSSATNPPLPSIESLTQESDFSPFMGKDVAADLRNQAMKKLFTNPHYNVQDGLDIYIGDYTKSDPIPIEMLRKMTQSKALFLFEEEEKAEADAAAALAAAESVEASEIAAAPETVSLPEHVVTNDETENLPAPTPQDVTDVSIKSH
jgi:Protein of unknown function (DUF3306)